MTVQNSTLNSQVCRTCKTNKEFSNFSFRKDTQKYRKECKFCRNQKQQKYSKTESGKLVQYKADQERNIKFAGRRKARSMISYAIKTGKIKPLLCFVCGDLAEAHHPDYSRPLDVVWLCKTHHKDAHLIKDNI